MNKKKKNNNNNNNNNKLTTTINTNEHIDQDEDDYDDTMNRILNAEIEIENNRKRIEILTEDRKELEKIQQIVHVPYQFIDMPFDKINIQYSNPNSEYHHDFALFMASRIGDDVAITHALQEGKELNFKNYRVTMEEQTCKYQLDFIPFHTTNQTALHVGYHNLEIIGLLLDYGFSCELKDIRGQLPEDIALAQHYKEEYKFIMYHRKNMQRKRVLKKIETKKVMEKIRRGH